MALQWLGLCAFTAEGTGSMPGRGAAKKKKKECLNLVLKNP